MKNKIIVVFLSAFCTILCFGVIKNKNNKILYPIKVDLKNQISKVEVSGFYDIEKWGRWTKGNEASLSFRVYSPSDVKVKIYPIYYLNKKHPNLNFSVYVNNKLYKKESITHNKPLDLIIKANDITQTGKIKLTFIIENPGNPKQLLLANDNRNLGIGIKSIEIEPLLPLQQKIFLFFQYYNIPLLLVIFIFAYCATSNLVGKIAQISLDSIFNVFFLAIIFSCLFIPVTSINQAEKSTAENRMLAKFPQFYQNGTINRNVGKEIEKWFNDRFNGRETIITYYEKLRFALSNIYEHKGHYYNKSNQWGFLKFFLRLRHMNKDERLSFINSIKKLKKFADKHHIDLYINIVPVATCIYPETRYPFTTDCSNIDIIRQDMAANGLSDLLILPYEELKGQKDLVMHKLEEHWSEYGAFIGYQAVMNKIKEKHPLLKILTEDDFIVTYSNQTRTDFGYKTSKGSIYHQLKLPKNVLTAQYKNYVPKAISVENLKNTSATTITRTKKTQNCLKVYIIGNSYVENLFYFMRYSFNEVIKKRKNPPEFNSWDFSRWKEDIIKNKPDILIISAIIEQGNPINDMFKEDK